MLAAGALTDVGQILQPNEAMGVLLHSAVTHHMVGVLLQPPLSPANDRQSPGGAASAFVLKTVPESRRVVGFGNKGFTGMKCALSFRGTGDSQVTYAHVNPNHTGMGLRCGVGYVYFQGNQQVEL